MDIPLMIMARVGDGEPLPLAQVDLPWPYDVRAVLPDALRELAKQLEDASA